MTPEEWFMSGDTGISSETIWHMTGHPVKRHGYPYDPADFGRCHRLLQAFPEWRARLTEVAARFPREWTVLVRHWDELTAIYEDEETNPNQRAPRLYQRMKQLECEAFPWCRENGHRLCRRGVK